MKMLFSVLALSLIAVTSAAANSSADSVVEAQLETPNRPTRFVNLRIEPHWLILRELSLDFQFNLGKKFSLGPTLAYMAGGDGIFAGGQVAERYFYDDTTDRTSFGIRGAYYFRGAQVSSAYVAGFGKFRQAKITSKQDYSFSGTADADRSGKFNEQLFGLTAGYQWNFGRLTLNVGAGVSSLSHPDKVALRANDGSTYDYDLHDDKFGIELDAALGFQL